jgi:hypothetical protein
MLGSLAGVGAADRRHMECVLLPAATISRSDQPIIICQIADVTDDDARAWGTTSS